MQNVAQVRYDFYAGLNEFQQQVVAFNEGLCSVIGNPGGGKTMCVVHRIARLVQEGVNPDRIMAMTFTKKAATEMNIRLASCGIEGCRVGTIHSVCMQIAAAETGLMQCSVDAKDRLQWDLKRVLGEMRRDKDIPNRGVDYEGVSRFIGSCKATGICYIDGDPFWLNPIGEQRVLWNARRWTDKAGLNSVQLLHVYRNFERRRATKGLMSFDDMLLWAWMALICDPETRYKWRSRWDVVIVDEVQDSNPVQWDVARLLVGLDSCIPGVEDLKNPPAADAYPHNLMVVGDPSQCHPPNTKVQTGPNEYVRIDRLKNGQTVSSWNRNAQKLVHNKKIKVASRHFDGTLRVITVANRSVKVTPGHKFLCRWTNRNVEIYVTYIMFRADLGYRVGWCKLFNHYKRGARSFHLAQQARIEKADGVWILKTHSSRRDASLYESIMAGRYGLPTVTFETPWNTYIYDNDAIKYIFQALAKDNHKRARQCLCDHHRDCRYPLYPWPNRDPSKQFSRATYFHVYACNLMEDLMSLPLPEGKNTWKPIESIRRRKYKGRVYSLEVGGDHLYVADGIVVHNSIYGFRDAAPELFVEFSTDPNTTQITLPINYRSNQTICNAGYSLVKGWDWHLGGHMESSRGDKPQDAISMREFDDPLTEASSVIAQIQEIAQGKGYKSCAVLSRLRVGLDLLELECIRKRIRYVKSPQGSFLESKEVKDVLGYLRVAGCLDPTGEWMRHIVNRPFRYFSKVFLDECSQQAAAENRSLLDVMDDRQRELSRPQRREFTQLCEVLRVMNNMATNMQRYADAKARGEEDKSAPKNGPAEMMIYMLDKTDYMESLRREEGLLGMDESKKSMLSEIVRMGRHFSTVYDFLVYVNTLSVAIKRAGKTGLRVKDESKVQDYLTLSTIHSAKGLEWQHVFVVDVVQGRFPCAMADEFDEELRLMYVALTRAMHSCQVSYTHIEAGDDLTAQELQESSGRVIMSPFIKSLKKFKP